VFRGYLYPSLRKSFGILPGILLTGVLFGPDARRAARLDLGHSRPPNRSRIIFTFGRAQTGTVLASFLLHLGYNSMIALATIIGTTASPKSHPLETAYPGRRPTRDVVGTAL